MVRVFAGLILLFLALLPREGRSAFNEPCDGIGDALIVDTGRRTMSVCSRGRPLASYPVSLGRGGVDKRVKGDRKTPRGTYSLGEARPSGRFFIFLPVAYPNERQKSRGYSGGNIGIHGPHRKFLWLGNASVDADWTSGCIAVGTDEEMFEVVRRVNEEQISTVIIR